MLIADETPRRFTRSFRVLTLLLLGFTFVVRLDAAEPLATQRERMVEEAVAAEGVTNRQILEVMRRVPRHEFIPRRVREFAYVDEALPISEGQTISPPSVVALMTQALDPQPEDRVLEIGTGSGYQAAVLSSLVREVYTIEIVKPLARRAADTLKRLRYRNVHVLVGDGAKGAPDQAPFDKILVTCSPEKVPPALVAQLKEGGRMVIPLGERYTQTLYLFTKQGGKLVPHALDPAVFVPMMGEAEAGRTLQPDPLTPHLINGGFEELAPGNRRPAAWYHQRQLQIETSTNAPAGQRFVTFRNRSPGRQANASQAFAIDGKQVGALALSCWVRASDIQNARGPHELGALVVTFSGKDRVILEATSVGRWSGTFGWRKWQTRIQVPPAACEAILAIGLFGATGAISFDDVAVEPAR